MRRCPACSSLYDDAIRYCPRDGIRIDVDDQTAGLTIDARYRLEELIGHGAMGAVYRATQLNLQRTVAVKVVKDALYAAPSVVERFKREALAIARLRHPNIVAVFDFGVSAPVGAYLVMELLEGRTLRQELQRAGRLHVPRAVDIMVQVCGGIHAAHGAGVLHRDLKPENIFLDQLSGRPVAKVLDFGIAKLLTVDDATDTSITRPGTWMGTPIYMSPEQSGGEKLDARSDVYSLGCVLYEMLTGTPPLVADSVAALMQRRLLETPEPPSRAVGVPRELDAVVLRALAKERERRFDTAGDFANALTSWLRSASVFGQETAAVSDDRAVAAHTTDTVVDATFEPASPARRAAAPHNLPVQVAELVDRDRDVDAIAQLVRTTRLVTLTGPGGIGKTRLAIETASRVLGDFPDGVWFVDLAPLADPGTIASSIASIVGAREAANRAPLAGLCDYLRSRRVLILIDNCEHLVAACATIARTLVESCAEVHVVATSQEALAVSGEAIYCIEPLSLPESGCATSAESLMEYGAVRLFVETARLHDRAFRLTQRNADDIGEICRRLDGIPLAIQLAAARAHVISPKQILARLEDRFNLLTGGDRTAPRRHQTLRAALEWSFGLLTEDEGLALRRVAVFAGGFTLDAAELVVSGESTASHSRSSDWQDSSSSLATLSRSFSTLDVIARLVDKSLVAVDRGMVEPRYRVLETIRQFALDQLRGAGEEPAMRARHFGWCLDFADRSAEELYGPEQVKWFDALQHEHDNLRAALRWSVRDAREARPSIRLASRLGRFWQIRGPWREGVMWFEEALALPDPEGGVLRARALDQFGVLLDKLGDHDRARSVLEESLALARASGRKDAEASVLHNLGTSLNAHGDRDGAARLYEASLALNRELGNQRNVSISINSLALVEVDRGEFARAGEHFEECLSYFRASGNKRSTSMSLNNLGYIAYRLGDLDRAARLLEESLALAREVGDRQLITGALNIQGTVAACRGDLPAAFKSLGEAIALSKELEDATGLVEAIEAFALAAAVSGEPARALVLLGAAGTLRTLLGCPIPPYLASELEPHAERARSAVGAEVSARALDKGASMDLDDAIRCALDGASE